MTPKAWLFLAMGLFVTYYAVTWVRNVKPEDGSAEATGNPPPLALIINALIGVFFGWVSGGGLQYTDNRIGGIGMFATAFGQAVGTRERFAFNETRQSSYFCAEHRFLWCIPHSAAP